MGLGEFRMARGNLSKGSALACHFSHAAMARARDLLERLPCALRLLPMHLVRRRCFSKWAATW
jgi:hypothetical protein